jgi:hypothetical protein
MSFAIASLNLSAGPGSDPFSVKFFFWLLVFFSVVAWKPPKVSSSSRGAPVLAKNWSARTFTPPPLRFAAHGGAGLNPVHISVIYLKKSLCAHILKL